MNLFIKFYTLNCDSITGDQGPEERKGQNKKKDQETDPSNIVFSLVYVYRFWWVVVMMVAYITHSNIKNIWLWWSMHMQLCVLPLLCFFSLILFLVILWWMNGWIHYTHSYFACPSNPSHRKMTLFIYYTARSTSVR